ncbi:ribosomal protein S18-alanine N-acetyltransferase [Enterococcus sp. LJL90]
MLKKFKEFLQLFFSKREPLTYPQQQVTIHGELYLARQLEVLDVDQVFALEGEVYFNEHPWTRGTYIHELRQSKSKLYLGLFLDSQLLGFVGCRVASGDCHITNVAVKPALQSSGLGSWLIDEVEKFAIMWQCESMSLEVRVSNLSAQRLYRRKGFVSRKVKYNYYDDSAEDALDMVKYL